MLDSQVNDVAIFRRLSRNKKRLGKFTPFSSIFLQFLEIIAFQFPSYVISCPRFLALMSSQQFGRSSKSHQEYGKMNLNFSLGFNSIGASASINHLHFHLFYTQDITGTDELPIERFPSTEWLICSPPKVFTEFMKGHSANRSENN